MSSNFNFQFSTLYISDDFETVVCKESNDMMLNYFFCMTELALQKIPYAQSAGKGIFRQENHDGASSCWNQTVTRTSQFSLTAETIVELKSHM